MYLPISFRIYSQEPGVVTWPEVGVGQWGISSSYRCIFINTLRLRQDGRHFPDDIFKCIFLNENARISLKKSLKFVPKVRINNIPALVQIMAWRRSGDKPLSESMVVNLLKHICVTRPQWDNDLLCVLWFKFHWSLFPRVQWTMGQHWFR